MARFSKSQSANLNFAFNFTFNRIEMQIRRQMSRGPMRLHGRLVNKLRTANTKPQKCRPKLN